MELITQVSEGFESGTSLFNVADAPLGDESLLLAGRHHGETGALANQPGMVIGETGSVGVLASSHQRQIMPIDKVVEELGEELGEPPHADQVTARGVVLGLPRGHLGLVELLLVVLTVELDDFQGDFLIDCGVESLGLVRLLKVVDEEIFVTAHDLCLLSDICSNKRGC